MIDAESRYAQSAISAITVKGKDRFVIVPSPQQAFTFNYQFYQVLDGDRIDAIAYKFYGDPLKWWVIADANPQRLDWGSLVPGELIRIPMVTQQ